MGTRCSFVVERLLMVRWVVGSIPRGGPIELFIVPASGLTKSVICAILSMGWCI